MKLYCIIQTVNNAPDLSGLGEITEPAYEGLCAVEVMDTYQGELDPWRPYLLSGTPEQMSAIAALPTVIATEIPEDLSEPIPVELACRLNEVLVPLGQPGVPEGMTYLEAFLAAKGLFGNTFPLDSYSVAG